MVLVMVFRPQGLIASERTHYDINKYKKLLDEDAGAGGKS